MIDMFATKRVAVWTACISGVVFVWSGLLIGFVSAVKKVWG